MKVLLINPPTKHVGGSGKPTLNIPIGLLSIASVLEKLGHDVKVYDTKADLNIYHDIEYTVFGDSWETIRCVVKKENPDVVGISNPFTVYLDEALKVAQTVKSVDEKIPVVMGGPHASVAPMDFLKDENVDFVVMCEGEYTFPRLLDYLEGVGRVGGVKSLGHKADGKPQINQRGDFIKNLDELPFPAYHLVDMEKYFNSPFSPRSEYTKRAVSMVTSRGCPFNCVFCSIQHHMGRVWRPHSPEYVLRHVRLLVENYKIKLIHFEDDNLTLDKPRFEKILDGIIDEKLKIKWDTPNGVRADTLDRNLLVKAKKSGCQYLIIGVESGSQRVVNEIIGKSLDLERVKDVAKISKEIGLDLEAFFVVGLPGETRGNIAETFEFAKMLNKRYSVYPSFHIAAPLLNTRLYQVCKEGGFLTEEVNSESLLTIHQGRGIIKTQEFSPEDLKIFFDEYKNFILMARIKKALKHPNLIKSYIIKRISKTPVYSLVKN